MVSVMPGLSGYTILGMCRSLQAQMKDLVQGFKHKTQLAHVPLQPQPHCSSTSQPQVHYHLPSRRPSLLAPVSLNAKTFSSVQGLLPATARQQVCPHSNDTYICVCNNGAEAPAEALWSDKAESLPAVVKHSRSLTTVSAARFLRGTSRQLGPSPEDASH